ncbi:MAG: ABC transporter ATP-binding protein [Ruminococcaceae bacterium]|nr:ABC transporter ATP-binding protein [Oscillospiraceae bacterium]
MELEIKNICKHFRKAEILKNVSLKTESGNCIGILGSNGTGKSTLLSILAGVQIPDSGEFLLDGQKPVSAQIGYVPQGTPLMEELTARDNLLLWYSRETMEKELQDGVLHMLGIGEFLNKQVRKLSGGMKKRLSIGCAVFQKPPVLLLDEPTAALDLICKEQIRAYLQSYKESGGILLLTTHDPEELALCDATYILKDGVLTPYCFDGDMQKLVANL